MSGGIHGKHRDVLVLSATRTAIGKYGGGLAAVPPCDLAATVVREAVSRAGVDPADVGHAVFGHVIHTEVRDMYLGRVAAVNGGLPVETPGVHAEPAVRQRAAGDRVGRPGHQARRLRGRGGRRRGVDEPRAVLAARPCAGASGCRTASSVDAMVGALTDPFDACHMGVTAENVAAEYGVSRADQDALAAESHRRAAAAADAGYFTEQITPVQVAGRKGTMTVDADEHIRPGVTTERPGPAAPAFAEDGTVTAGNSSGINDAAAAVVLADRGFAERNGHSPLGRLVAYAHAGVEPRIMGMGPVPAVRKVLERAGMKLDDIDVFEVNEAFAAQALAVVRELGLPPDRTNPNGSGVSLGHPLAATGAILTVKALYELRRTGGRYALVTMCIGGGQGIAAIFERA